MSAVLAVVVLALVGLAVVRRRRAGKGEVAEAPDDWGQLTEAWASASEQAGPIGRIVFAAAKPLSTNAAIGDIARSPFGRRIELRLQAAGRPFGGTVEIFVSAQVAAAVLGAVAMLGSLASRDTALRALLAIVGIGVAIWPYRRLTQAAKARSELIADTLPEFAEILQMPLLAGSGSVVAALDFTAKRISGPVAETATRMVGRLSSNTVKEADAFLDAGEELGTPEAKAFFHALARSYFEGVRIVQTIAVQAEQLRDAVYQRRRAEMRKFETKLVLIAAMHFLPLVFLFVIAPAITGLGRV